MKLAEGAIRAGYRINAFDSLASTNDEAMARARAGDRGRLWIVAARQTGGRGRQGRAWASPVGNVYASLLLIDPAAQSVAPQIGLVAGVALAQAVDEVAAPDEKVAIKWPNDLVHRGAKLAGILVEGARLPDGRFACVLGFGVNRESHPAGLPYRATDLFAISPRRPDVAAVVSALTAAFHDTLTAWDRGRGFQAIRTRWLAQALPRGTPLSVAGSPGRRHGIFETIDDRGRLVLATDDGLATVDAGDVFLLERPVIAGEQG